MRAQTPPSHPQSIRQRLILVNVLALIFLLTAGSVLFWQMLGVRLDVQNVLQVSEDVRLAFNLQQHVADLIASSSRLVPNRDAEQLRSELQPVIEGLRADYQHLATMGTRVGEDQRLFLILVSARSTTKRMIEVASTMLEEADQGNWEAVDTRLGVLERNQEAFASDINRLYAEVQHLQGEATDRIRARMPLLLFLPASLVALAFAALAFGTFELFRRALRPLGELTDVVRRFAQGDLNVRVPVRTNDEFGELARAFNDMAHAIQDAQLTLEQRVEARTRDLQHRLEQIRAAAEVGSRVTRIRDLDKLLDQVTHLISERFGFYHTGIFLVDAEGEYAELRAANSEGGRRMLEAGHKLRVGEQGIVGFVTATGQPRIALDVGADAVHFENPYLPDTHSEMALPLRVGDRILGALDVQSKRTGAFAQEDILVLQIVADQLAVAIDNAHLLEENRSALDQMRRAYTLLSREGWVDFVRSRPVVGYRVDASNLVRPVPAEEPTIGASDEHTLEVPIQVRGHRVGVARLRKPAGQVWTAPEQELAHEIADRLSSALESARLYSESLRRAQQLQIASEIARDASSTLNVEELLDKVVHLIRSRFGFYHASIFLVDPLGEFAVVRASTGEAGRRMLESSHRLAVGSRSIMGYVTAKGEPLVVNDVTLDPTHRPNPLLPDTRAEAGIPLKVGDRVLGAIDVQSTHAGAFTEDDISVLQILADQLAIALVNAELFQETQEHLAQQRLLHHVTTAAASTTSLEDALFNAIQGLHATLGGDRVAIMLYNEETDMLEVKAAAGYGGRDLSGFKLPIGEGITGWAAANRKPVCVDDVRQDPRYVAAVETVRSELAVPLIYRDQLFGVLNVESDDVAKFDEVDQEMLTTLAGSLAAILANIELLNEIQQSAQRLSLLHRVTATAASHVNLTTLLQEVSEQLVDGFRALHCGVVLFDSDRKVGRLVATASSRPDAPGRGMLGAVLPLEGNVLTQEVIRTRKPVVVYRVTEDERVAPAHELLRQRGTETLIIAPLISRGEVIGTIGLDIEDPTRVISEQEINLLDQISRQIASAVDVARLFEQAVRRADRERLVTEITTKLRASNDPRVILETAARELGRALNVDQTQVWLTNGGDD